MHGATLQGASAYDLPRAARMGSFGLCFYGPYQHFWYRALDARFPGRAAANFVTKVALNQLCLAPVVIGAVFAWNLGLQAQLEQLPRKVKADFVPTMLDGARARRGRARWCQAACPVPSRPGGATRPQCCDRGCAAPRLQAGSSGCLQPRSTSCLSRCSTRCAGGVGAPCFCCAAAHPVLARDDSPPSPPLNVQVLYMSSCGVLWTGYLSYSSERKR